MKDWSFKKVVAVTLIFCILFTAVFPLDILAWVSVTKYNSTLENQELLNTLNRMYGDDLDAEKMLEEMKKLGILNQEGDFVSSKIKVDGQMMTLEEIQELLNHEDVDLDKVVYVDDIPITLANLQIMIDIEYKINDIRKKYFESDVILTKDHFEALDSLEKQINTEGITFANEIIKEAEYPSGIKEKPSITFDSDAMNNDCITHPNEDGTITITVTLSKEYDEPVSFKYSTIMGSAGNNFSIGGKDNYQEVIDGEVIFSPGETSKDIIIQINKEEYNNDLLGTRWTGEEIFYISFYDVENAFFSGNKKTDILFVRINNDFDYRREYDLLENASRYFPTVHYVGYLDYRMRLMDRFIDLSWKKNVSDLYKDGIVTHMSDFQMYYNNPKELNWKIYIEYISLETGKIIDSISYTDNKSKIKLCMGNDIKILDEHLFFNYLHFFDLTNSEEIAKIDDVIINDKQCKYIDKITPEVLDIAIQSGTYIRGEQVPISVFFSEPVDGSNLTITVNGQVLSPQEKDDNLSYKYSFLYTVRKDDAISIEVKDIKGAVDLSGKTQDIYDTEKRFTDVKLESISKSDAFSSYTADVTFDSVTKLPKGRITIDLSNKSDDINWIFNEVESNNLVPSIKAKVIGSNGNNEDVDLYVDDISNPTKLIGNFTPPSNSTGQDKTYGAYFFLDEEIGSSSNLTLMQGVTLTYNVPTFIFADNEDDFSIIYEKWSEDDTVFLQEGSAVKLDYSVNNQSLTWKEREDFRWSSSDETVATISDDGVITPKGVEGSATFTLTATNGGVGTPYSIDSKTLNFKVGLTPFLIIPEEVNTITIQQGKDAKILWTTNIIQKNIEYTNNQNVESNFSIKIYPVTYIGDEMQKGNLVKEYTAIATQDNPINFFNIPSEDVNSISLIGRVSYMIEVSTIDPYTLQPLVANAYIAVVSNPAIVRLTALEKYYVTDDTDSININYTLDNFDKTNQSEFELKVTKNEEKTPIYSTNEAPEGNIGNYKLPIDDVEGNLKDVYIVSVKAKNQLESTCSYDSYVLYVYHSDALKIMVDGSDENSIIMDNSSTISNMTSEEILQLDRKIGLSNIISINGDQYEWAEIADQIIWKSDNSVIASINYKQGGLYDNILNYYYSSYSPNSNFMLSGLADGQTKIRATHKLTGMEDSLDITVNTLKDKLYLFQVFPRTVTTFTYTNGNGVTQTVNSNENGEIAIYEESGIKGDVYLKSTYSDMVYLGTIYNENLLSSENDSSKMELYPRNNFELRPIAKVDLAIINIDGEELNDDIIIRGGIYKNGEYCSEALINSKDGKTDQSVKVDDGRLTINLDTTQFWVDNNSEQLTAEDKLEFIFELQVADNVNPELITIDANMGMNKIISTAENIIKLRPRYYSGSIEPFIIDQTVIFPNKNNASIDLGVKGGRIGLSDEIDELILKTNVMVMDDEDEVDTILTMKDKYKTVPEGQQTTYMHYPFTKYDVVQHSLNINKDNIWIPSGYLVPMTLNCNSDNKYSLATKILVLNMKGITRVVDSETVNEFNENIDDTFLEDLPGGGVSVGDKIINDTLQAFSSSDRPESTCCLTLMPTSDPTCYRGLLKIKIGSMAGENPNGVYMSEESSSETFKYVPGLMDVVNFAKGTYLDEQLKEFDDGANKGKKGNTLFTGGGYLECEISYDFETQDWRVYILNGGLNAGVGYEWSKLYNTLVGPVPVTAQFSFGVSGELSLDVAVHHGKAIAEKYDEDYVTDYLTELRTYFYIYAFGGMGFDFSVVALKIGVFGQLSLDGRFRWLNRPYLDGDDSVYSGQYLEASGKTGIEFYAKFLFVSYKKVLASVGFSEGWKFNNWDYIDKYWKENGKGTTTDINQPIMPKSMCMAAMNLRGYNLQTAKEETILEERDYLKNFERSWNCGQYRLKGFRSLDQQSEASALQTNSYPYANPVFTEDGAILAYISDGNSSDIEDTIVCYSAREGDSYKEGNPIDSSNDGYGDSALKITGNNDFAAATWVRQYTSIKKEAGEDLTNEDIALMSNSTEVMASIYDNGNWITKKITQNTNSDLAPVVATNGEKVLVAWRNVSAPNPERPLDFTSGDKILYKIYDGSWGETKTLYNGTNGNVLGIEAQMLSNGTSAVAYTVDTEGFSQKEYKEGASALEVMYGIINRNGDVIENIRMTNDLNIDENPQLTKVTFDEDNTERFVLGWYSVDTNDEYGTSDIRLCTFNDEGAIYNKFIDSINSVNINSKVTINNNFRFSKGATKPQDLSIVWKQVMKEDVTVEDEVYKADKDGLFAVKVLQDNENRYYITSAKELAIMAPYTVIDHFDARMVNGQSNKIKAVILGTNYNTGKKSVESIEGTNENIIIEKGMSSVYTATGDYDNKIRVDSIYFDYPDVKSGMDIPIQFNVFNEGYEPISNINITLDKQVKSFDLTAVPLLPGNSISLMIEYTIPEDIVNPDYSIKADFTNKNDEITTYTTLTDTIYIDIPDVGISSSEVIYEGEQKREVAISLYDNMGIPISSDKHRVKIAFYDNSACAGEALEEQVITSQLDIDKINRGTYITNFTFDMTKFMEEGKEIPEGGLTVYGKTWIEENINDEYLKIHEYDNLNNETYIPLEGLKAKADNNSVTIQSRQMNSNDSSQVKVTIQNNSLWNNSSGNIIVNLVDEDGSIVEQTQLYNEKKENKGLVNLRGEESNSYTFDFTSKGVAHEIEYTDTTLASDNAQLSNLCLEGIPLDFNSEVYEYTATVERIKKITLNATTSNPNTIISINDEDIKQSIHKAINVSVGENIITLVTTAEDGSTKKTYTVKINVLPSTDATMNRLSLGGKDIELANDKYVYSIDLGITHSTIIKATVTDGSIYLNGQRLTSEGENIYLSEGENKFKLVTKAEDGITTKSYLIKITTRRSSSDSSSSNSKPVNKPKPQQKPEQKLEINEVNEIISHYTDVKDHWAIDSILYAVENGLMQGTSQSTFEPNSIMTRGMVTTLLLNYTKEEPKGNNVFIDVPKDSWYENGIIWAYEKGIVNGVSKKEFKPENPITREALVKIIYNYCKIENIKLSQVSTNSIMDIHLVSPWARDAVDALVGAGIIKGRTENTFAPKEYATRAEVAVIMERFIKFINE
ncbi:S-layer homology domain-containing protein [Vallitalea guaymasensis]|uniref:S-layer homology domain-containing protein n=1 Tax=Vallitalea guaymasensis TaxID=1185412 RepID=UPI000DE3C2DB|nr:S-layer homology domain-containing protein [Vallitalea guaymasensis]